MENKIKHKWEFKNRFRTSAFGWKGSRLACQRLKEAVSEIKKVKRKDPILAAEGVVLLLEKIYPALQFIDSSSGALGIAVNKAQNELLPILINAQANQEIRDKWLNRLWDAIENDGVDFLNLLGEQWGEVCGSKATASKWADYLISTVLLVFKDTTSGGYFAGTIPCLSCLLYSERYKELLDLLELPKHKFWFYRQFGVQALKAMGKISEALEYAEESKGLNSPDFAIDRVCEDILISAGSYEEAYRKYGLYINEGKTYLSMFRTIAKRYPKKDKLEILNDLIEVYPGTKGKWFTAAKDLGELDLALKLVSESPCDPKTLNRAAKNYLDSNTEFALGIALASLKWLADGYGYEITNIDVLDAYIIAMEAALRLKKINSVKDEISKIAINDRSFDKFVMKVLGSRISEKN